MEDEYCCHFPHLSCLEGPSLVLMATSNACSVFETARDQAYAVASQDHLDFRSLLSLPRVYSVSF